MRPPWSRGKKDLRFLDGDVRGAAGFYRCGGNCPPRRGKQNGLFVSRCLTVESMRPIDFGISENLVRLRMIKLAEH